MDYIELAKRAGVSERAAFHYQMAKLPEPWRSIWLYSYCAGVVLAFIGAGTIGWWLAQP